MSELNGCSQSWQTKLLAVDFKSHSCVTQHWIKLSFGPKLFDNQVWSSR